MCQNADIFNQHHSNFELRHSMLVSIDVEEVEYNWTQESSLMTTLPAMAIKRIYPLACQGR